MTAFLNNMNMVIIMKNVILTTLGMGLLAMGLNANAVSNVPMGGVIAASCDVPNTPVVSSATGGLVDDGSGSVDLAPNTNGTMASGDAHIDYALSYCNAASDVTLTTINGAITTAAAAPAGSGFTNAVQYTAGFSFGSCNSAVDLDANGTTAAGDSETTSCNNAESDTFTLDINTATTGTDKLVAGTYADILVVSVVPQ
jgi:hypothetical protein